jgi:PAS domain S-box-containing protein
MARILKGETLESHELEILVERPDGMRRNVLAHPFPLKNEHSEIIGAINCLYDITERKQLEEALRESEERFHAILHQATAGILRKDAKGRLIFVNQAFCNMLGYTESEVLGKTIWEFMHKEDIQENKRSYNRLMAEGAPFNLERRLIRKDGSILWVDTSVSPVMDNVGRPQSAVTVEVDITARKQAEEALQQINLQLESRVQQRTSQLQAAYNALQESRSRLQVLSRRLVQVQDEERRILARELHDRVGQTLAALNINLVILSNQLSDRASQQILTRLDDSMQLMTETIRLVRDVMSDLWPPELDEYGLEAALQSYLNQYASRFGIKVGFEKPETSLPRLGPTIEMTLMRITQGAFTNIARHAHAQNAHLSLHLMDDAVHLAIQDDGVGMDLQGQLQRTDSHGLKIMRERAEAVGGKLKVQSTPGSGTKVEVYIPIGSRIQTSVIERTQE